MKKILFSLIAISMILASCKKEHKNVVVPQTGGAQKVTFSVAFSVNTGFIQVRPFGTNSIGTSSTPDTALTNHINEIYYMVFDSAGNNLHNIQQLSTDTAFGHYIDNLHPGKYTIAIGAGTNFYVTPGVLSAQYIHSFPFSDFFFGKTTITIGSSAVSQSISLDRKTSKLIVNIKDALPVDPKAGLSMTLGGVADEFFVGDESIASSQATDYLGVNAIIPASARGKTNFQFSTFYLYKGPFTLDILCQADQFTVYGEKIIPTVNGGIDKITTLTGNLFGGSGTSQTGGFQTTLDTTWIAPRQISFP